MKPRHQLRSALFLGALTLALVGCNSGGSSSINSPTDLSPPQTPANFHASHDVPTQRDWLAWDPSASASVASYEVHYSSTPGGVSTILTTVDASTDALLLAIVSAPTTEYYRLRAVGTNGVPSAFTPPIPVTRAGWEGLQPTDDPDPGHAVDN